MNLARIAAHDAAAKKLLLKSTDFAIRAARHFNYQWPIEFDVRNFAVLKASRDNEGLGQTDVGGLYAYLMLQLWDLTQDETYLCEAKAALKALEGIRFELVYQTNLTAWGAVACIRLWKLENDARYLDRAYLFIAGFLHNCELWDSQIEQARHYPNFFGATCLHDAPYMSAFECFESFAAFEELLQAAGDDLPEALKLLILEYRRFTLHRAWYFYPDALPPEVIKQDDIRNGYIDRRLSFPLEDVYGDGQPAGQVGQEVYGSGGAFVFASQAYHRLKGVPFLVFTDYPATVERTEKSEINIRVRAPNGHAAVFVVLAKGARLPQISCKTADGAVQAIKRAPGVRAFVAPENASVTVSWKRAPQG